MTQWNTKAPQGGFRRSVYNAGWRSGQAILLNAISVPAMAYIIRRLGPTGYGQWSAAVALIATVTVLTNLGLRGTFVRAVARDPASAPRALAEQLGTRLVLALFAAGLVALAAFLLHYPPIVLQCVVLAAVAMIANTIFTTASDLMEAFQRFPAISVTSFAAGLALTVASVLTIALDGGPVALAASYLLGPVLSAAILYLLLRRERFPIGLDIHPIKAIRLLWASRHFTAQQLLCAASNNITLLLLPKLIGVQGFGLFSAGILLVTRMAIFPEAMGTAFYPMIAKLVGSNPAKARRQTLYSLAATVVLCVCVAVATTLLAGPISRILFPKSPAVCWQVIVITMWALPLMGIESVVIYALNAAGHEAAQARLSLFATITNLALGSFMVFEWGIVGACCFMLIRPAIQVAFSLKIFIQTFFTWRSGDEISHSDDHPPVECIRPSPQALTRVAPRVHANPVFPTFQR